MKNEGESERFQFLQSPEPSVSQTLVSYCQQGAAEEHDTLRVEEQGRTSSLQAKDDLYRQRKQKYKERRESKLKSSPNVTFNKLASENQFTSKDLKNELRHKSRLLSELTKNDAKVSKKLARQSEENLELKATNLKQKNLLLEKEAQLANYKNQVEILTLALQNATQQKAFTQPASNQSSVRKDLLGSNLASFMGKEVSRFNPSRTSKHSHQNSEQIFPIALDAQKFVTPKIRKALDEIPAAPMHPRVSEMLIQEEYDKRTEELPSARLDSSAMGVKQRPGSLAGEIGSGRMTLFEEIEKKEKKASEQFKKRVFNLSQIDSIFQTIKLFSQNILERGSETEIILIQELKNLFWSHLLLMSELQTKHQLLLHRDAENKELMKLLEDFTGIYNALAKKYEILEVESNNRMMEAQIWESLQNKSKPREAMINTFINEPGSKPGLSNYDSAGGPSLTGLSTPQPHSRHSSSDIGFYFYNRNQACYCGAGTESVNSSECNSQGVLVHHHRCPSSKLQQLLKFKSLDEEQLFRELAIQHSKCFYYKQAFENRELQNVDLRSLNSAVNSSASQLVLECQRELQNSILKIQSLKLINQQLRQKIVLGQPRGATIDLLGDRPQGDLSPAVIEMSSSSNASSSSTLYPAGNFLIEHARHQNRNLRENMYEIKPRKPW